MTSGSLVLATLRALLRPRRLVPILLVCIPVVAAQGSLSADPLAAPLAVVMSVAFVTVGPVAWRVLFPDGQDLGHAAIRFVLYGTVGAGVVLTLGAAVPKLLGMGVTFLTARSSLVVCATMFLVGGWGLGRNIGMEAALERSEARAAGLAREADLARLLALRAHLDPHFLFNTLNAIAEWCRTDGATAERAVLELARMLRALTHGLAEPTWPLARELELVRTLLSLHLLRDPELFTLDVSTPEPLPAVAVPPLLLLPLAENAVKHGPAAGHRGTLRLAITHAGGRLRIDLENPGRFTGRRVGGSGLAMTEKRLSLAYGAEASMSIGADGDRTHVALELPLSEPGPGHVDGDAPSSARERGLGERATNSEALA